MPQDKVKKKEYDRLRYLEKIKDKVIIERVKQTKEEKAEYHKKYRENNREKIYDNIKRYKQNNREKVLQQNREYRIRNSEKIKEYSKKFREEHREEHNKKQNEIQKRKRLTLKQQYVEKLGGKCSVCGYDKCIAAFDFHHVNESDKLYEIGTLLGSQKIEELKVEIEKCILICSNCHRELHYNN